MEGPSGFGFQTCWYWLLIHGAAVRVILGKQGIWKALSFLMLAKMYKSKTVKNTLNNVLIDYNDSKIPIPDPLLHAILSLFSCRLSFHYLIKKEKHYALCNISWLIGNLCLNLNTWMVLKCRLTLAALSHCLLDLGKCILQFQYES